MTGKKPKKPTKTELLRLREVMEDIGLNEVLDTLSYKRVQQRLDEYCAPAAPVVEKEEEDDSEAE